MIRPQCFRERSSGLCKKTLFWHLWYYRTTPLLVLSFRSEILTHLTIRVEVLGGFCPPHMFLYNSRKSWRHWQPLETKASFLQDLGSMQAAFSSYRSVPTFRILLDGYYEVCKQSEVAKRASLSWSSMSISRAPVMAIQSTKQKLPELAQKPFPKLFLCSYPTLKDTWLVLCRK